MAKGRRAKILAAATVALILALYIGKNASVALFDSSKAVQINPDSIENSTLIIGTHLIYLHSLGEDIYKIAIQSASDSGQQKLYYKSELAGGLWMDITDAGSIDDISAGGTLADLDEIRRLYLTHHTKSDGITYDLLTGQSVCIFDIVNVYDLENMPELQPLKMQYDMMDDSDEKTDTDKHNIKLIKKFWKTGTETDATKRYDSQMQALQAYYEELSANGADSKYLDTVLDVMEKLSNARKAAVYKTVEPALQDLQNGVADLSWALGEGQTQSSTDSADAQDSSKDNSKDKSQSNNKDNNKDNSKDKSQDKDKDGGTAESESQTESESESEEGKENPQVDDTLLTAIGDSQSALGESMAEAEGNMFSAGTTVLTAKGYELSQDMILNAESSNYGSCDEQNIQLQYLDNITNSRIVDAEGELALLEELVGSADAKYSAALSAGATPEYGVLVAQNVSHAARENRIKADISDAGAACGELEFLIQETVNRKSSSDAGKASDYILQKIQESPKFKTSIKQDDYYAYYQDSVSGYVQWLNSLLKNTKQSAKDDGNGNKAGDGQENLYEQKAGLQEQKLKALDALDLDTARKIDAKIADIDAKIGVIEDEQSEKIKEITAKKAELEKQLQANPQDAGLQIEIGRLESELASGTSDISDGSNVANIINSKNEALRILADGVAGDAAKEQLADHVELLGNMLAEGSPLALEAMKEVYAKMLAKSELDGANEYDKLLEEVESAVAESTVAKSAAQEDGTALSGESTAEEIAAAVEKLDKSDGAVVFPTKKEGGGGGQEAGKESGKEGGQQGGQGGGQQGGASYIPAESLAKYLGYRYIWNESKKTAILSRGKLFYSFTAYEKNMETDKGGTEMDRMAIFSGELYIPCSFVQDQFDCYIEEIPKTSYSVIAKDKDALSELIGKGGG